MKTFYWFFLVFLNLSVYAQNAQLAQQYYAQGDFDKAAEEYKLLVNKYPYNKVYLYRLVEILQKEGFYSKVDSLLNNKKDKKYPPSQIWLAQNYLLQKDSISAEKFFNKGIKTALKSSYLVYQTGKTLQKIYQLDRALALYKKAYNKFPNSSFELEEAQIYAEKNRPVEMMKAYLSHLERNPQNLSRIRYLLSPYLSAEEGNSSVEIIKKTIIEKIREKPLPAYYRLLEWFYIQEKNYKKAFFQLRSLYAKKQADIGEIYYLGLKALKNRQETTAQKIFTYIKEHAVSSRLLEKAELSLLRLEMKHKPFDENKIEDVFASYINENWSKNNQAELKMLYADFLSFHKNNPEKAIEILNKLEEKKLSASMKAKLKLKKGDIFLQQGYFNQALIMYTQVQLDFPNHEIGHLATYKIAQASFFKGDIEWAHNQLKIIKSIHSDLIANDALDLDMLIINNKTENDSLQTPLKKLVGIKYLIFKNKMDRAIEELELMKQEFKGQDIYDDILWTQARLFEKKANFAKAILNYKEIIEMPNEIIYKDDAIYRMALIYENEFNDFTKARKYYKKIIIDFPGSFWFTDARKAFRRLRGDEL